MSNPEESSLPSLKLDKTGSIPASPAQGAVLDRSAEGSSVERLLFWCLLDFGSADWGNLEGISLEWRYRFIPFLQI